eukprot:5924364-Amphidinium_carterae.1
MEQILHRMGHHWILCFIQGIMLTYKRTIASNMQLHLFERLIAEGDTDAYVWLNSGNEQCGRCILHALADMVSAGQGGSAIQRNRSVNAIPTCQVQALSSSGHRWVREHFERRIIYLHHVLAVAIPALPTSSASKRAVRRGDVRIDGTVVTAHDADAPPPGSVVTVQLGCSEAPRDHIAGMLDTWNKKSLRPEAQIRVLYHDGNLGLAVVNKPCGMHCQPCHFEKGHLTLQSYLSALLPPPSEGHPCRGGPKVCHRLDFR